MNHEKSCGAVVYYNENGIRKYLIEHMRPGHYSICKGHVEGSETETETAEREIREETGLTVRVDTSFRRTTEYSPCKNVLKQVVFFVAKANTKKTVAQPEEVSEILWLPVDEATARLTYESDKKIVAEADKFIEKNNAPAAD